MLHPDRTSQNDKDLSTQKFQVLSKVYEILTDKEKKTLYDETGLVDEPYPIYTATDAQREDCKNKYAGSFLCFNNIFKTLCTHK